MNYDYNNVYLVLFLILLFLKIVKMEYLIIREKKI